MEILEGVGSHGGGMSDLAWMPSATSCELISCGADGKLMVTDPACATTRLLGKNETAKLTCLAVHPAGKNLAVGDDANFVKVCSTSCFILSQCSRTEVQLLHVDCNC